MKVIGMAAITIDGKIARSDSEFVSWTSKEDKKLFFETTKQAGVIVVGRKTFETFPAPLPGRLHIVLTKNPTDYQSVSDSVEYTAESPLTIIENLKNRGYKEVIIAGGAHIYTQFLASGVVNELWVSIEPILFGTGINLLNSSVELHTELLDYTRLGEHGLLVKYKISP